MIGEWVGVYREENEIIISLLFQTSPIFSPKCTMVAPCLNIPIEVKLYLVRSYSRMHTLLGNVKASSRRNLHCIEWVVAQIEVVEIINGPIKVCFLAFCGKAGALKSNSKAYSWKGREPILSFSTTLVKNMLRNSKLKINIMEKTWKELLPPNFKLRWINIWD